jgi:hydroxypyruvate reductase
VLEADHPIPTGRNIEAARAVEAFVSRPFDGTLIVLLSGGGSALLTSPRDGLSLEDLRSVTTALMRAGRRSPS